MNTTGGRSTTDAVLAALRHPLRRWVVREVAECSPTDLDRLARRYVASNGVAREDQRRVKLSLLHTHVPQLADAGILEHDARTGGVTLTTDAGAILDDAIEELESLHPADAENAAH